MDVNVHSVRDALGVIDSLTRVGYSGVLNLTFHEEGRWPWRIHIRSFISSPTTGIFFKGDGRGPSTVSEDEGVWSRVRSTFVVDPSQGSISELEFESDPTIFYGIPGTTPGYHIPPDIDVGRPTASISNRSFGEGIALFDFHHYGKDPLTPGFVTPSLDVHSTLSVTEDIENGVLTVKGSFTGDSFPSAEAFVVDQSGMTKVFLGTYQETGGVHSLFGDNKNPLFNVDMQIMFDDAGNFTGVREGTQTYTVDEWNKHIQDEF
ncbi:hypothetical protein LS482_13900 [Sinomicrobium kalidii]|uniref:hypothetical protein n=1 Tax=Sinomicrobium kalidii TaxID=2900738 RepID=UPI001E394519|nr:hypothetical protein [Sinomicrobium kalidii]UGU14785.1 hypothetical protein LS482_13900 [Sinomicrobium kalidii]